MGSQLLLGKVRESGLRQSFHSSEKRLQLAILLVGDSVERRHFWVEPQIDRLVLDFVAALEVRPVTFVSADTPVELLLERPNVLGEGRLRDPDPPRSFMMSDAWFKDPPGPLLVD